ncbi:MAG: exosortase O [Synechococcus sp.]
MKRDAEWQQGGSAWITSISLFGIWGFANASALQWLASTVESASLLNLGLALGVVGGVALSLMGNRPLTRLKRQVVTRPQVQWLPLVVMLGALSSTIAVKSWADIPQLELALFVLGTYGLLGLFLKSTAWKQGVVSAILLACVLPFSTQFQTGLGIPARVLTAHFVEQAMHLLQFSAVSANDIIVLENGIAHVDLPCSGLKSLWTGSLFLLLVTWLEHRQLGLRWLMAASGTIVALFWANAVRVLLLVLLAHGLNTRQFAEMLHVPLGLIGFCISCGLGWLFLQWVPKRESDRVENEHLHSTQQFLVRHPSAKWQVGLVAVLAVLAVASNHVTPPMPSTTITAIQLPPQLHATSLPLTQIETQFFQHSTFPIAEKWRFDWDGTSGSMLVVASHAWQAHHPPELCFAGNGFDVDDMTHQQIAEHLDARWLSLENGTLSATYWFQSPQGTTDDFMARFVESITHRNTPWTMVSILFDRPLAPSDEEVRALTATIRSAVADSFIPSHSAPDSLPS